MEISDVDNLKCGNELREHIEATIDVLNKVLREIEKDPAFEMDVSLKFEVEKGDSERIHEFLEKVLGKENIVPLDDFPLPNSLH